MIDHTLFLGPRPTPMAHTRYFTLCNFSEIGVLTSILEMVLIPFFIQKYFFTDLILVKLISPYKFVIIMKRNEQTEWFTLVPSMISF